MTEKSIKVRTRLAPSPTGFPHLGLVYQALFDYVLARKYNGSFILRIEDTDRNRFVEGAEDVIYKTLQWVGFEPDESPEEGGEYGPYKQSQRLELYQKYANELIEKKLAYRCFCTKERLDAMRQEQEKAHLSPRYDRTCLNLSEEEIQQNIKESLAFVIRMKIPDNRQIIVHDEVVGDISFDSELLDDQVILKSDGYPTYHLAVVVDDYHMKITHVFRGTEWVPSLPKHVILWEYLGWKDAMPKFIHVPILLNSQGGGKLSKRHAHTSVNFYREQGYLPEAVVNYLANIVWNHPEGKEIFPVMDFGKALCLETDQFDIKSNGVKFDLAKLDWMNAEYIRSLSDEELANRLVEFNASLDSKKVFLLAPLVKERLKKLADFWPLTDFIFEKPQFSSEPVSKLKINNPLSVLQKIYDKMEKLSKPWDKSDFEETFQKLAHDLGLNNTQMFQLIRIAISGKTITPPIFECIQILGEDETLNRIREFLQYFE